VKADSELRTKAATRRKERLSPPRKEFLQKKIQLLAAPRVRQRQEHVLQEKTSLENRSGLLQAQHHPTNRKRGEEISPAIGYGPNHLLARAEKMSTPSMVDMLIILRRSQSQQKKQSLTAIPLHSLNIYKRRKEEAHRLSGEK
jgi:hypothetical protein